MVADTNLALLTEPLIEWFQQNKRTLPWREDPTPYHVWVSEIMLQQTRVEAVKPYYDRFLRELPDVGALAACKEERLLKLWEGLGYYNRVRNMQAAARTVVEEYDGVIPADYKTLLTLKGIGHYTAGAIASIAYGIPEPAVDGNVLRVLTRACADDTDITKVSFRTLIEEALREVIPGDRAGTYNQALMELGAMVCLPNGAPHCAQCPWQELCAAHQAGTIGKYPVKKKKQERKVEERTVLIIRDTGKIALRKRPETGLLAGMYEFPALPGYVSEEAALKYIRDNGFLPLHIEEAQQAKHIFSHVEWRMKAYVVWVAKIEGVESIPEGKQMPVFWVELSKARDHCAIPSAFSAYMKYLDESSIT